MPPPPAGRGLRFRNTLGASEAFTRRKHTSIHNRDSMHFLQGLMQVFFCDCDYDVIFLLRVFREKPREDGSVGPLPPKRPRDKLTSSKQKVFYLTRLS